MHEAVIGWVSQFRTDEDLSVLDIGGRDLNGTTRGLFPNASPYHVLDLRPGLNVDIVADAATWRPDRQYDLVLCTEVFEHTPDWKLILETAWNALRPGGWLIVTCAGDGRAPHSGIEATSIQPGEYYRNIPAERLRGELRFQGWTEIECRASGTDTQACAVKPLGRVTRPVVTVELPDAPPSDAPSEHDLPSDTAYTSSA